MPIELDLVGEAIAKVPRVGRKGAANIVRKIKEIAGEKTYANFLRQAEEAGRFRRLSEANPPHPGMNDGHPTPER